MSNIIALAIFIVCLAGIAFLIFKKLKDLANLPEEALNSQTGQRQLKQNLLQKTALIQQAVLHNKKVEAVMAKAGGRFKTIFANRAATQEEMEKVEKIHQEGDYWHKVGERQLIASRGRFRRSSAEPLKTAPGEHKFPSKKRQEVEPQPKKPRVRKKKAE